MKTTFYYFCLIFFSAGLFLSSCKSQTTKKLVQKQTTPSNFKDQLTQLAGVYLELKDALVDSDEKAASGYALKMFEKLNQFDSIPMQKEMLSLWEKEENNVAFALKQIAEERKLAQQRKHFNFLSQSLISILTSFDVHQNELFVQYCPMANNGNGAHWLSDQAIIKNPYYGAVMLHCGSVVGTFTN